MADIDPYGFGDASDADRLRFVEQQAALASTARRVSTPEKTVEYQPLKDLAEFVEWQELRSNRASRMHTVYSKHARAV